ncbi:MAG: B12-binding domain-containing radical SAM protein [Acidimicrobiia bacterium]|nr:B12-binding domain-containing radical SAM protein [Acidimicrobiia bacterium]
MQATQAPPLPQTDRMLLRVVGCRFPPHNVYRYQATKTTALGPVTVATVAKAACVDSSGPWLGAEVIDENNYRKKLGAPRGTDGMPDHLALQRERYAAVVGLSCGMSTSAPRCLELIRTYREMPEELRPKAIVVGGWHATDNPEVFLEAGADAVVHGEAEAVIADLLTAIRDDASLAGLRGVSFRTGDEIVVDARGGGMVPQRLMDRLPDPDFGLIRYADVKIFPVGRTRGCDGRCRFCRVKSGARWMSPERFLDQLKVLASRGARRFFVIDDRSEQDLPGFVQWLEGLEEFERERKIRLSLTTQNRLSLAEHPDVLALMRRAGVSTVAIGFESPIPEELKAMKKPLRPAKMLEWNKTWKRHGFFVHMMLIFGYPIPPETRDRLAAEGETISLPVRDRARRFMQFIRKARPDTLQILLFTPLPGTEDRAYLEDEGRIYPFGWEYYDGTWLTFEPDKGIDPVDLQYESIKMMRRFYGMRGIWRIRILSLLVHLARIGAVTVALPVAWPTVGWRGWLRAWRDSKLRLQGHLVIGAWLRNYERIRYPEQLARLRKAA